MNRSIPKKDRIQRIKYLLNSFGIQNQAKALIGTPIRRGISGGQKRRVSVAAQLITCPKIIFLDEPTSGLDSTASYEVMSFVKALARKNNVSCTYINPPLCIGPEGGIYTEYQGLNSSSLSRASINPLPRCSNLSTSFSSYLRERLVTLDPDGI